MAATHNGDVQMKVVESISSGGGRDGDFAWMIRHAHYRDALFVFNDNQAPNQAAAQGVRDAPWFRDAIFFRIHNKPHYSNIRRCPGGDGR